jgi:hypothetical protein
MAKYEIGVVSETGHFRIPYAQGDTIQSTVRDAVKKIFGVDLPQIEELEIKDEGFVRKILSNQLSSFHLLDAPEEDLVVEDIGYRVALYKPASTSASHTTRFVKEISTLPAIGNFVMLVPYGYFKDKYLQSKEAQLIVKSFLDENSKNLDEFVGNLLLISNGLIKAGESLLLAYKNLIDPTIISAVVESPIEIPGSEEIYFQVSLISPFNLVISIGKDVPLEYRKILYSFAQKIAKKDFNPVKFFKNLMR